MYNRWGNERDTETGDSERDFEIGSIGSIGSRGLIGLIGSIGLKVEEVGMVCAVATFRNLYS